MEWVIVAIVFVIFFTLSVEMIQRQTSKLPPGPTQFPLVGSLYAFKKPLHKHFTQLSEKYGPIIYLRVGAIPVVIVSSGTLATEVLKSHDSEFASRPETSILRLITLDQNTIGLSRYSPKLIKLRRIALTNLFSPPKLAAGAPQRLRWVRSLVMQVLDLSNSHSPVTLTTLLHDVASSSIFSMLFGRQLLKSDSLFIESLLKVINNEALRLSFGDMFPWLGGLDFKSRQIERRLRDELIPQLKDIFDKIIHGAGGSDTSGFVNVLMSLKEDNALEDVQITGILSSMIVAGVSTSGATMDYAMAELVRHPKVLRKAQEEIDNVIGRERLIEEGDVPKLAYLNAIVKETMRLHNPVPLGLPHCNPASARLGGYHIPANAIVFVNHWAMGRNESVWENAQEFQPERFLPVNSVNTTSTYDHEECYFIPFGGGKRKCLGQGYSMRLVPLVIGTLVQAFDLEGEEVDMSETTGGGIRRQTDLVVRAFPRLEQSVYSSLVGLSST